MTARPTRAEFAGLVRDRWPTAQTRDADRGLTVTTGDPSDLADVVAFADGLGLSATQDVDAVRVFGFPRRRAARLEASTDPAPTTARERLEAMPGYLNGYDRVTEADQRHAYDVGFADAVRWVAQQQAAGGKKRRSA